jgi:hypothetical protein
MKSFLRNPTYYSPPQLGTNTEVNMYTRVTQLQWLKDKLALSKAVIEEQQFAEISHTTLKAPASINPDCLPKNYKDAMLQASMADAYNKDYRRFKERNAFKIVRPEPGVKYS